MTETVKTITTKLREIPMWVIAGSFLAPVLMNLLANKSIDFGVSWMALDCGVLVSWLAFLCMDLITIHAGAKAAVFVSIAATFVNVAVAGLFALVAAIPGTWGEAYILGSIAGTALDNTFSGNWFILFGSCVAYLVSAIVNSLLNAGIGKVLKKSRFCDFAARSYISTAVGQFVDNMIFALIVSTTLFGWDLIQCAACSITGACVELLCEIIFSPVAFKVSKSWQKVDKNLRHAVQK